MTHKKRPKTVSDHCLNSINPEIEISKNIINFGLAFSGEFLKQNYTIKNKSKNEKTVIEIKFLNKNSSQDLQEKQENSFFKYKSI